MIKSLDIWKRSSHPFFCIVAVVKRRDENVFFYKGDPSKKWAFFKKMFFALVNLKNIHFVKIS